MITKIDIEQAYQAIHPHIKPTALINSLKLSQRYGCDLLLKLENRHMTGSFKERGALNKLLSLSPAEGARGVIAASAGNHAQGVAYNATRLGIASKIVMPQGSPLTKIVATQGYGAEVILHGETYDDAYDLAQQLAVDEQRAFIHAFDDPLIIAGQGTAAIEVFADARAADIDVILCPIGGGGLIGGIATYVKAIKPTVEIIGVEAAACASMALAMAEQQPRRLAQGASLADGIAVKQVGQLTYRLAKQYVDDLLAVSEDSIAHAVLTLLETEKQVVEGSGAVPLAALAHHTERFRGKKLLLIISGGNIDVNVLDKIITRGLTVSGRIVELTVRVPDKPGFLVEVLGHIRHQQANVLEVAHHRYQPTTPFGQVDIAITLETKGQTHVETIKQALAEQGYLV